MKKILVLISIFTLLAEVQKANAQVYNGEKNYTGMDLPLGNRSPLLTKRDRDMQRNLDQMQRKLDRVQLRSDQMQQLADSYQALILQITEEVVKANPATDQLQGSQINQGRQTLQSCTQYKDDFKAKCVSDNSLALVRLALSMKPVAAIDISVSADCVYTDPSDHKTYTFGRIFSAGKTYGEAANKVAVDCSHKTTSCGYGRIDHCVGVPTDYRREE